MEYQPGDIVNGHVWTGTEWVPVRNAQVQVSAPPAGESNKAVLWIIAVALVILALPILLILASATGVIRDADRLVESLTWFFEPGIRAWVTSAVVVALILGTFGIVAATGRKVAWWLAGLLVIAFGVFVLVMAANTLFDKRGDEAANTLILSLVVMAVGGLVIVVAALSGRRRAKR
jgi:MFS family permease